MTLRLLQIIALTQNQSGAACERVILDGYGEGADETLKDCLMRRFVERIDGQSVRLTATGFRYCDFTAAIAERS